MHDLTFHNYYVIAALFVGTFILWLFEGWLSEREHGKFSFLFFQAIFCLSKVFNIGLGIAVGIEFFMLAHGG